jgi:antibiotic biosynthesis monooxygenase (ABM) superfamily enzyme
MYGTIARMRLKPGAEAQMQELMKEYETLDVPGYVSSTVYRMDADSNEIYLAVVFEDKETYRANAGSPEQDARYRKMVELLDGEPDWHDGEVIYSG